LQRTFLLALSVSPGTKLSSRSLLTPQLAIAPRILYDCQQPPPKRQQLQLTLLLAFNVSPGTNFSSLTLLTPPGIC
jgi:hypothetical protein